MSISRRHFLRTGAIVFAASAPISLRALTTEGHALGKGAAQQSGTTSALMSKAAFTPHLNTVFYIRLRDGQEIPVKLVELRDSGPARKRKSNARAAACECFTLDFRAPEHPPLEQNTYRIEHRSLGQFDLFIGPMQSKKHGQVYEAIINHQRA